MAKAARTQFRTDIEGLRGLAIALVVVFHVFVGKVSAGVDVFLLMGGIFFFSSQLSNARRKDGLTVVQSLLRILRRLFPLLVVVVAATLGAGLWVLNRLMHKSLGEDAVAALGYFINWTLAFSGREYTNVRHTVSPFQHLWSMSAQLQIYVASLLAVVLIALIFRRFSRPALLVILTAATVLSFGYATWMTTQDQAVNYYSTFSRFWEVGLGGLIGLVLLRKSSDGGALVPPMGRALRWMLGVVGLLAIICTGIFLNGSEQFPGPWTLVPLGGAALVVLAGTGGHPVGVTRLLETRFFQFLGRISYALYLWHWPILVLVVAWLGQQQGSRQSAAATGAGAAMVAPEVGAGVIAVSVALAWLSSKLVEKPLRQGKKPQRSWVVTSPRYVWSSVKVWPKTIYAMVILLIAGGVLYAPVLIERQTTSQTAEMFANANDRSIYPGAGMFLHNQIPPTGVPIVPPLADFDALLPQTQPDGCQIGFEPATVVTHRNYNQSPEECAYGDVESDRTLYVIGGSHSEHYIPAMDLVGIRQGIKIVPLLKMGCPVGSTVPLWTGEDYPSCREWSDNVMKYILDNPPTDGVFMTGTRPSDYVGMGPEVVPQEYVDVVRKFTEAGIHSYLIRDNPWHMRRKPIDGQLDQRTCVAEMMDGTYGGNSDDEFDGTNFPGLKDENTPTGEEIETINKACGSAVEESLQAVSPQYKAYEGLDVTHLDLTLGYCKDGWCPAIIGNIAVYRDAHHFTNVFAATLTDELERQMFSTPPLPPAPPLQPHVAFPPVDPAVLDAVATEGHAQDEDVEAGQASAHQAGRAAGRAAKPGEQPDPAQAPEQVPALAPVDPNAVPAPADPNVAPAPAVDQYGNPLPAPAPSGATWGTQ